MPIDDGKRDDHRLNFSAVFSDFYLFDSLLGWAGTDPILDVAHALRYLEHPSSRPLGKVKIHDGALLHRRPFQGQRKRLALLTAYLEDRPFYLFDEWASDQDPLFKDVFLHPLKLYPSSKARNKAVLVITHDDHYFHLADRMVKLDYGRVIVGEPPVFAPAAAPLATAAL